MRGDAGQRRIPSTIEVLSSEVFAGLQSLFFRMSAPSFFCRPCKQRLACREAKIAPS